jgi:hypothetical protein
MRIPTGKSFAAIVFTLGLVSMVVALVINHHRISAPVALKMVSSQRFVRADGKSIVQAEIKRFQRGDGSYTQPSITLIHADHGPSYFASVLEPPLSSAKLHTNRNGRPGELHLEGPKAADF